jgi:hypothetical protein
MDIYWPGMLVLVYTLCGLGFTIQGAYALSAWNTRRRQRNQAR